MQQDTWTFGTEVRYGIRITLPKHIKYSYGHRYNWVKFIEMVE